MTMHPTVMKKQSVHAQYLIVLHAIAGEKKVFTFRLTVGCLIAIIGFCLYSHFKLWAQKPLNRSHSHTSLEEAKPLVNYTAVKGHAHGDQKA